MDGVTTGEAIILVDEATTGNYSADRGERGVGLAGHSQVSEGFHARKVFRWRSVRVGQMGVDFRHADMARHVLFRSESPPGGSHHLGRGQIPTMLLFEYRTHAQGRPPLSHSSLDMGPEQHTSASPSMCTGSPLRLWQLSSPPLRQCPGMSSGVRRSDGPRDCRWAFRPPSPYRPTSTSGTLLPV
jgi:hypothetical protein